VHVQVLFMCVEVGKNACCVCTKCAGVFMCVEGRGREGVHICLRVCTCKSTFVYLRAWSMRDVYIRETCCAVHVSAWVWRQQPSASRDHCRDWLADIREM